MRIAIIGAPGSGKSKIARRVARRLNKDNKNWVVIDGYVDRLRDRTGWTFGAATDFRQNFQVIAERWTLEDEAIVKGKHSITCGSIFESIIYSSGQSVRIPSISDESLMLEETQVARAMMQALGISASRYFNYDGIFLLPLKEPNEDTWDGVVDAKLSEVLESFFISPVTLNGTDKQKVDRATDILQAATPVTVESSTEAADE